MDEVVRCHYCGDSADTIDHAVPQSLIVAARDSGDEAIMRAVSDRRRRMTVTCCKECNNLAGSVYDQTLAARKARIAVRFERRHRRELDMPDWAATELMEISELLRGYVLDALIKRDHLRERMRHLRR